MEKSNYEKSKYLKGAISCDTLFLTFGKFNTNDVLGNISMDSLVRDDFKKEFDFYYNENGAVLEAFNLSSFEEYELDDFKELITIYYQNVYPEYELELKQGCFPMGATGIFSVDGKVLKDSEGIYSTHILYAKNYKECINNKKTKKIKVK